MGMDNDNGGIYDFEVDKANYRKFKKKLERAIDDKIRFEFKVTNVIDPNHTQGEITSL
jgi:hypothetical protein